MVDKLLGGAIKDPVGVELLSKERADRDRLQSLEEEKLKYHNFLKEQARQEFDSQHQLRSVADSLADIRPRNVIGYNQYLHHLHRHSEDKFVASLSKLFTGHGSSKDHPRVHQLFMDSLAQYPDLINAYVNA